MGARRRDIGAAPTEALIKAWRLVPTTARA
jgi:hypothetical protein